MSVSLDKAEDFQPYICHYLTGATSSVREIHYARGLGQAMAAHNYLRPEYAQSVLKWVGPTGINFLMHDSRLVIHGVREDMPEGWSRYLRRNNLVYLQEYFRVTVG